MARQRSTKMRAMEQFALPDGWTSHEGQVCPVDPDDTPAIIFRRGTDGRPLTMQAKYPASKWENYGARDCWGWLPGSTDGADIVAYRIGAPPLRG